MGDETDTAGRKWVPAPGAPPGGPMRTGSVTGVMAWPGQTVRWRWTHLPNGESYVSGYELVWGPEEKGHGKEADSKGLG